MKSISQYLDEDYEKWGDNPYISIYNGERYQAKSFRETIDAVRNAAKEMLCRGWKDKNIVIYSENSYEWMVLYLSILGYAGCCIPVDKEWTDYDMMNVLSVMDIAVIFYSVKKKPYIDKLKKSCPKVKYICIEEEWDAFLASGAEQNMVLQGEQDLQKTVMVLFTSGTTNIPKGIPLSQANLFNNWETLYRRTPMTEQDVSYLFLPLNHVYSGVANFLYSIVSGMQIYLCHDIKNLVGELLQVRPTVVCSVPLILQRIYEGITEEILAMLRGIRFLYCGGSFMDMEVKRYFIEKGVCLLEAYGTTETSSVIALAKPGDTNIEANGVVFENLEVQISEPDEEGVGEILVRGGSVSSGYLSRNDKYSDFDEEGFYHTGDLGCMDETRHLYLKGRKKRMILTANGKNVYIDELEEMLLANAVIIKAKVFEEKHHVAAEVISNAAEDEIRDYINSLNRKLPDYKKIKELHIKRDTEGDRVK